jgi:hypothetical protein
MMKATRACALLAALSLPTTGCIDSSDLLFERTGPDGAGATGYQAAVLADGPLAYWPLDEVVGGTRTPDASGNGHDAFIDNDNGSGTVVFDTIGATAGGFAATLRGGAALFVDAPHPLGFGDSSYTLEAWVRIETAESGNLMSSSEMGGGYTTYVSSNSIDHKRYSGTSNEQMSQSPMAFENFRHVAVVYDATVNEGQMYVDGQPLFLPPNDLNLTWTSSSAAFYLSDTGVNDIITVDEVAVYASALSAERISLHHACGVDESCD